MATWLNPAAQGALGKGTVGGACDSVLAGWLVLRALGLFLEADRAKLQRCLSWMLALLAVLFVAAAFADGFGDFLKGVERLRAGNQGNESLLEVSYGFLALRWVVYRLPYVLDVLVVLKARQLLHQLQKTAMPRRRWRRRPGWPGCASGPLSIALVSNLALQLLQLLCARWLFSLDTLVQFPLLSLVFVLGVLLLAQYIRENKQLKDDNDLFV